MSYEPHTHAAQIEGMRHLLFVPEASFVNLQKTTKLSSDHFTFHLRKLIEEGYAERLTELSPDTRG